MEKERMFYKCYSFRLKKFIEAHGIYPISTGVNPVTDNVYHVFKLNDELSRILTNWSKHKQQEDK